MKKVFITAIVASVLLSVFFILASLGTFRPKCSVDFATKVSFTSISYAEDGTRNVDIYDLTYDSLKILKGVFNGQKIYKSCDSHTGFENYVLTFSDGIKTVRIRLADDKTNYIKHDQGYFALTDEQKENLYNIVYQFM